MTKEAAAKKIDHIAHKITTETTRKRKKYTAVDLIRKVRNAAASP